MSSLLGMRFLHGVVLSFLRPGTNHPTEICDHIWFIVPPSLYQSVTRRPICAHISAFRAVYYTQKKNGWGCGLMPMSSPACVERDLGHR
ncbi:hypothetical protein EI94DRAFT_1739623 [Lactarius quietus]|nr:hypothetical protein EI94DRAFT_1739623 [Lactarius quietus]